MKFWGGSLAYNKVVRYEAVFWDFDGVWSRGRFYTSLAKIHPKAHAFVETGIWGPCGGSRVDQWMRAERTMDDINRLIAQETGIDFDLLTRTFLEDVAHMEIEMRHIPIVLELKRRGIKVGMVTNNMDVFDRITRPRLDLDGLFDGVVVNSFAHRRLKAEGLYEIAMQQIGHTCYDTTLLIDDSPRARAAFEARGGHTYAYHSFDAFQSWIASI